MSIRATSDTREKWLFFRKFVQSPRQFGSVIPSSRSLSAKMVDAVDWSQVRSVAELGAGTGAVTQYIDQFKTADTRVFLFEKDPVLLSRLANAYPQYISRADVLELYETVRETTGTGLDCIISGLPFANFPQHKRDLVMEQIVRTLNPGGWFIAFQYSLQMKRQLERQLDIVRIDFVLRNMPPAFVYVCRKRG